MADTNLLEKKENLQDEQNDSEQNQRLRKKVDFEPMLLDEDEFKRVFDSFLVVEQARKAKKGQEGDGYFKYQGRAFDPVTDEEATQEYIDKEHEFATGYANLTEEERANRKREEKKRKRDFVFLFMISRIMRNVRMSYQNLLQNILRNGVINLETYSTRHNAMLAGDGLEHIEHGMIVTDKYLHEFRGHHETSWFHAGLGEPNSSLGGSEVGRKSEFSYIMESPIAQFEAIFKHTPNYHFEHNFHDNHQGNHAKHIEEERLHSIHSAEKVM